MGLHQHFPVPRGFSLLLALLVVLVMSLALSAGKALADIDTGFGCVEDVDCLEVLGDEYYCLPESGTCWQQQATSASTPPTGQTPGSAGGTSRSSPGTGAATGAANGTAGGNATATSRTSGSALITAPRGAGNVSVPAESLVTRNEMAELQASLAAVQQELTELQTDARQGKTDAASLKTNLNTIQQKVNQLERQLSSLPQQVDSQIAPLSTGLAGLQQNLTATQSQLSQVEQDLARRKARNRAITFSLLTLVVVATGAGLAYYLNGRKKVNAEIVQYITHHIRQGKKYPQIREALRQAGWSGEEINWAYQHTLKHNYQKYLSKKGAASAASRQDTAIKPGAVSSPAPSAAFGASFTPAVTPAGNAKPQLFAGRVAAGSRAGSPRRPGGKELQRNKILSIAAIAVLLLLGVFFVLRGTVGKAIFVERYRNTSSGEIVDVVRCTPPHILDPERGVCCLDEDSSGVCDAREARQEQLQPAGQGQSCADNLQCAGGGDGVASGEYCIDGECRSPSALYQGSSDCDKLCNYYAVRMVTSDGETYTGVRPGQGSYTAAGALEWRLLRGMPQHCEGERAIVPIVILTKEGGQVIGEKTIVLRQGETSDTLTHPYLSAVAFSLTLRNVHELCEE